ncbi:copper chaperone PCu(A)C [Celerinatantimonas sp. YJH-8]|uniref:copper chaperone PCu(A)C n=1 Tax=Celerinatantimonas sp. YJH-8 TaxID=3228714 RepID=UPI0038C2AB5D
MTLSPAQAVELSAQQVDVVAPVIFMLRPPAKATGSRMAIINHLDKPLQILSVSCEAFSQVMFHSVHFRQGQQVMEPVKQLQVSAHGRLVLTPNTTHLMFMAPKRALSKGEYLQLILHTSAGDIKTIAQIVPFHLK